MGYLNIENHSVFPLIQNTEKKNEGSPGNVSGIKKVHIW